MNQHVYKFQSPLDGALAMSARGYKVFPIVPNGKKPAFEGWQNWAENSNLSTIRQYGKSNPASNWGVYAGASNLAILDVDNKQGCNGSENLKHIESENERLPETTIVRTPTGGLHLYFRGLCSSGANKFGQWIDVKSRGGYVVCPGSVIDGKTYDIVYDVESIPELPQWAYARTSKNNQPKTLIDGELIPKGMQHDTLVSLAGTMRRRGMPFDAIYDALLRMNDYLEEPAPDENIERIARDICKYAPENAEVASDFLKIEKPQAITADTIDVAKIPKRDWIMQNRYLGGYISVLISPGGLGKSTLSMLDAVAIATGQPLTGYNVVKPGAVWIYNTEDPIDELQRRITAISQHHNIPLNKMKNVHISSGRQQPLIVAKSGQDGVVINQSAIETACDYIREHNIVLLIVDPLVRAHECRENDNMEMDKVAQCFNRIADRTGCAICLVHHASKEGSKAENHGDMNASRGATALVNASRIAFTVAGMSDEEAQKFGVHEDKRRWYMRLDNAKANLQPPAERADWFEKINVELANGDGVGTIQRVDLVDMRELKKREEFEAEKADLGAALYEIMQGKTQISVLDAVTLIATNPEYSHLFDTKSDKRRVEEMIELLQALITFQGSRFLYYYDDTRRPKHWIVSEYYKQTLRTETDGACSSVINNRGNITDEITDETTDENGQNKPSVLYT